MTALVEAGLIRREGAPYVDLAPIEALQAAYFDDLRAIVAESACGVCGGGESSVFELVSR